MVLLHIWIPDYTLQIVLAGTAILGFTSGSLGVFAMLRRQSLLGDAISHASFPGIVGAFLLTQSRSPVVLMIGGACAGIIGTLLVHIISSKTSLKKDSALGIVLSVFFGLGLVLLTFVQKKLIPHQALLNKFLFGDASTLLYSDVITMAGISFIIFFCLLVFWKEFKLLTFDPVFTQVTGYSTQAITMLLTLLLVLSIVIGIQTVGVVLMSTMLIAPAAAAKQWTHRLESMVLLAGLFGLSCSVSGALITSKIDQLPTGPMIVVIASCLVIISLLFSSKCGLVWQLKRKKIFS